MSTITRTVYLYAKVKNYGDRGFEYWTGNSDSLTAKDFGRCIASAEVAFSVPDDLDPVAMEIDELNAQKAEAARAFQMTMAAINDRLAKLQAITNEVPA